MCHFVASQEKKKVKTKSMINYDVNIDLSDSKMGFAVHLGLCKLMVEQITNYVLDTTRDLDWSETSKIKTLRDLILLKLNYLIQHPLVNQNGEIFTDIANIDSYQVKQEVIDFHTGGRPLKMYDDTNIRNIPNAYLMRELSDITYGAMNSCVEYFANSSAEYVVKEVETCLCRSVWKLLMCVSDSERRIGPHPNLSHQFYFRSRMSVNIKENDLAIETEPCQNNDCE